MVAKICLILFWVIVTTLGSAVVASLGKAVALVEAAPACNLVSDIEPILPLPTSTCNSTGLP